MRDSENEIERLKYEIAVEQLKITLFELLIDCFEKLEPRDRRNIGAAFQQALSLVSESVESVEDELRARQRRFDA